MENVTIKEITTQYVKYVEITALPGYCFYDIDNPTYFMTHIATPITDMEELASRYIVIREEDKPIIPDAPIAEG